MGGARGAGLAPLRFLDPDLAMVQRPQCLALIGNADIRRVAENEWRPLRNIDLGIIIIDVILAERGLENKIEGKETKKGLFRRRYNDR
jgi:hypothetical protein